MATSDEIRVQALGFSVDDTPGGGAAGAIDAWRTGGGAGGRNNLNTAAYGGSIDPVPNRAINDLNADLVIVKASADGFDDRFTGVLGDETPGGPEEAAFQSIGIKMIPAVAGWTHDFTNTDTWSCTHDLNSKYVTVRAVKDDGTIMIPDIDYAGATDNSITLHFVHPVTGTCVIRR